MLGDLKRRLVTARAQGALAVAELAVESGDAARALSLYREQARDLSSRDGDPELALRGWLGVLRSVEALLGQGQRVGDAPREACAALERLERGQLPGPWARYEAWRGLGVRVLASDPAQGLGLAGLLRRWFPSDPRGHYLWARAQEALLPQLEPARRGVAARAAVDALYSALQAAEVQGSAGRWSPGVTARAAQLLWRHVRAVDPTAAEEAQGLVEGLDRQALAQAPAWQRLVAAEVGLSSPRAMTRLRALDGLEALLEEGAAARTAVMPVVEGYLEGLGWGWYGTEHDRVRAILSRAAPHLDARASRRARAYLELLEQLHGASGRRAAPSAAHLERLAEFARDASGAGALYYGLALELAAAPVAARAATLEALLAREARPVRAALSQLESDPMALALAGLWLRVHADRGVAREALLALSQPTHQVPHVLDTFALLLPPLLARLELWPELEPRLREVAEAYLRHARRPSFGFAGVGLAFLRRGDAGVAALAARRALLEQAAEPASTLRALLDELAARSDAREATGWLLEG